MEEGAILYNDIMGGHITQFEGYQMKKLRKFVNHWHGKMIAMRIPGDWEIYNIEIVEPINVNLHDKRYTNASL